ncbi:MAG TPA: hypothetical protein VD886_10295, partial [Herpetosiphonaceae bacterium]|nr:hypothetical protein [Herpetosiphonaceae bacterium]
GVAPLPVGGAAIGPANAGRLVQVRGTYLKAAGRDLLIRAADGTAVRLHPPSGMKKPRYRKGAPISAVGIVGRYDETVRLQLRSLADLGVAGGLPDTGGDRPWPWFWVIPALLGGGAVLRRRARACARRPRPLTGGPVPRPGAPARG